MAIDMKKIMLGVPEKHSMDALYPPVGLLYLAAQVRRYGHQVKVIDAQVVGEAHLLNEFASGGYDFFGTTVLSPLREHSYKLIRKIKAIKPDCVVLAGGAHMSILPEQTMRHVPEIDIAVMGEGEQTLTEILEGKALAEIAGICFRSHGEIVSTPPRIPLDPEKLPMPAWDLIDIYSYKAFEDVIIDGKSLANEPFLTIYSSRGCTGSCSFCSTWKVWRKWRQIDSEKFVNEVEYLYRRGVSHFFIADDSMINDENFTVNFAEALIKRGISIKYKIACRADKITPIIVDALKRSGCYEAHIGYESGSQKILDAMGKHLTVNDNRNAARLFKNAGMRVYALMIIGSIMEDVATVNETIDFLKEIDPDEVATMGGLMLLPGTRDYQQAVKKGVVNDEFWLGTEPFRYYTETFSRKELNLLTLFVRNRRKIWHRRLMGLQAMLYFYPYKIILGKLIGRVLKPVLMIRSLSKDFKGNDERI